MITGPGNPFSISCRKTISVVAMLLQACLYSTSTLIHIYIYIYVCIIYIYIYMYIYMYVYMCL